jgi:hypothetical protein
MDVQKLIIETDGTMKGTSIKINGVQVGLVQELTLSIKADPDSMIDSHIKYWRPNGAVGTVALDTLKADYSGIYSVYVTPFTGKLMLDSEPIQFVP